MLVDEFQDTDPVQWDILRRAFGDGGVDARPHRRPEAGDLRLPRRRRLRLPRGRAGGRRAARTLEVNWRSDQGLVDAYDALFGGARLGHEGIVYRAVRAATANQAPAPAGAPVTRRCASASCTATSPAIEHDARGLRATPAAREHIARDLAADLVALLSSGARSRSAARTARRAARAGAPGHVAVLVRTHRNAALRPRRARRGRRPRGHQRRGQRVRHAARRATGCALLEALERPTSSQRARAAALTPFLGWTAERVAAADEDDWEERPPPPAPLGADPARDAASRR